MLRKWLTPANLPDGMTAKDFWQEATFSQADIENFSEIIDQGAQTTLVCFLGLLFSPCLLQYHNDFFVTVRFGMA
jgi:hypothetical protein